MKLGFIGPVIPGTVMLWIGPPPRCQNLVLRFATTGPAWLVSRTVSGHFVSIGLTPPLCCGAKQNRRYPTTRGRLIARPESTWRLDLDLPLVRTRDRSVGELLRLILGGQVSADLIVDPSKLMHRPVN